MGNNLRISNELENAIATLVDCFGKRGQCENMKIVGWSEFYSMCPRQAEKVKYLCMAGLLYVNDIPVGYRNSFELRTN